MSKHGGWGYEWECTPETCTDPWHPEYTAPLKGRAAEGASYKRISNEELLEIVNDQRVPDNMNFRLASLIAELFLELRQFRQRWEEDRGPKEPTQ